MNWKELVAETARRTGESQAETARVLDAFQAVIREQVVAGENVRIPELGTLASVWRKSRALRSIADMRKIVLDGRFTVTFRPAKGLRADVAERTPQRWRDPRHQAAWRLAETLLGDLALYHGSDKPETLPTQPQEALAMLQTSFGDAWSQARRAYEGKVDPGVRAECDHLVEAAIARWT